MKITSIVKPEVKIGVCNVAFGRKIPKTTVQEEAERSVMSPTK